MVPLLLPRDYPSSNLLYSIIYSVFKSILQLKIDFCEKGHKSLTNWSYRNLSRGNAIFYVYQRDQVMNVNVTHRRN